MLSEPMDSGAVAGRTPQPKSPTWKSFPSIGGPAFAIWADSVCLIMSAMPSPGRIASATPRSRMTGATTSPFHVPSGVRNASPRRRRIAAAKIAS